MDNKNLLLALTLSIAILLVWQLFLVPDYVAPPPSGQSSPTGEAVPAPDGGTPPAGGTAQPGAEGAPAVRSREQVLAETQRVGVAAPRVVGSINLTGGQLDDLTLRDYRETLDPQSPLIVLLSPRGTPSPYYTGVRWLATGDAPVPDAETVWQASGGPLAPNQPVTLTTALGDLTYEVVYAIDADYLVTITQRVTNGGETTVSLAPYALVNRTGIPKLDAAFVVHEGLFGMLADSYQEYDYDTLMEEPGGIVAAETTGGWIGITDKYWSVILVPDQTTPVKARYVYSRTPAGNVFQTDVTYPSAEIAPGASHETQVRVFAGAREATVIDRYNDEAGIHRFYLAVDYGWIFFLSRPIYLALEWFYGLVGNFGVAILLLVVCVRILLFPLANKAYKSMAKMRKLQPKMLELRERYKDDRPRFQQEIMGLYRKEGANPLAGCLPILLQIPIFIALYNVLYGTIEMRHAPFFGWIQDLSAPDPTSWINLFGLLPFEVPDLGLLNFFSLGVWPLLMGFTMWAQYRLNPQPTDPMQAKIFAWMPIIFTFMLGQFAAGLVIYWAWNNLLSMGQQIIIMKRQGLPIGRKAHAAAAAAPAAETPALEKPKSETPKAEKPKPAKPAGEKPTPVRPPEKPAGGRTPAKAKKKKD